MNGLHANAAMMMTTQQVHAYQSQIQAWARRVVAMRDLMGMAREAGLAPSPQSLIRSMPSLTQSAKHRATSEVERALLARIGTEEDMGLLRRARPLLQGHYPRVVQALDARLRAHPSS